MKVIFVLMAAVLAVQALTDEQKEKLKEHKRLCLAETGIDKKELEQVRSGDFSSTNPLLNDFSACVMKRSELLDENGKFNREIAIKKAGEENKEAVTKAIDACLEKLGSVVASNAFEYVKCYNKERPGVLII